VCARSAALAVDRARTEAKQAEEARLAALQERWAVMEEPAPGADGCVRVLVRLPNGQRLQRRFHATMPLRGACANTALPTYPPAPPDPALDRLQAR
jgi:hypothetical protein